MQKAATNEEMVVLQKNFRLVSAFYLATHKIVLLLSSALLPSLKVLPTNIYNIYNKNKIKHIYEINKHIYVKLVCSAAVQNGTDLVA